MIELSTIRDLVAIFGVIAGFSYYVLTVQANQKNQQIQLESRNTQFFMQLYNQMNDEKGIQFLWNDILKEKDWTTFDEWWDKYGAVNNPAFFAIWMKLMITYEMYGVLLKRGFLDVEIIDDIMSGAVLMMWDFYGPVILGFREQYGYPQFQEHQEYLTEEIRKMVNKQHPDFKGTKQT